MGIKRIGKHLLLNRWRVRRAFPRHALANIERAIKTSESGHGGQVRFVVEGALDGAPLFSDQSPRARALDIFSQLRIWDTEHNNGVLIYLMLADHDVEIVADRGIADAESDARWRAICADIERACAAGRCVDGVADGIRASAAVIARRFPYDASTARNELPDKPVVL
jgi:uncharacterized membrane protein